MSEITIKIDCPGLLELAGAIRESNEIHRWEAKAWADAGANPQKTEVQAEPATEVTTPEKQEAAPSAKSYTLEQVRGKGVDAARKHSRDAVKKILESLGVAGIGELKTGQYPDFVSSLEKLEDVDG